MHLPSTKRRTLNWASAALYASACTFLAAQGCGKKNPDPPPQPPPPSDEVPGAPAPDNNVGQEPREPGEVK
jgi:hypothetical protein